MIQWRNYFSCILLNLSPLGWETYICSFLYSTKSTPVQKPLFSTSFELFRLAQSNSPLLSTSFTFSPSTSVFFISTLLHCGHLCLAMNKKVNSWLNLNLFSTSQPPLFATEGVLFFLEWNLKSQSWVSASKANPSPNTFLIKITKFRANESSPPWTPLSLRWSLPIEQNPD